MSDTSDQGNEEYGSEDWFRTSDDVRQGVISGNTFEYQPVTYSVIDGKAIFEGDIVIAPVEDLEKDVESIGGEQALSVLPPRGIGITGDRFRWPGCVMPFEINHPNRQLVLDAIRHWEQRTVFRFIERNANNANNFPNFVVFEQQDGCWSFVGMQGGRQVISLGTGCGLGAAIHEIGHAVGLWHEQSREDRDRFVRINWVNIDPNQRHNFDQHIADGDDVGQYDFGSIMHYPRTAFSINGQPTIEPIEGQAIGQRTGLSAGDIAAIGAIYPTWPNWVSLQSLNFPTRFVRHAHLLGELTEIRSDLDRRDATFRVVPGLADSRFVSLESHNFPNHYLRHQDFRLKLHPRTEDQLYREDATFVVVPGLGNRAWSSLRSFNLPDRYVRHRDFHLWVESGSTDLFRQDATFSFTNPFFRL